MSKTKLMKLLFLIFTSILLLLYAGGYIAQFIYNYKVWALSGAFIGDGTAPKFPSFSILYCYKSVFKFPYGVYGVGICVIGISILVVFMRLGNTNKGSYDSERNLIYSSEGTYGTSGYMTEKEMKKVLRVELPSQTDGIILGRIGKMAVCLPAQTKMNRNIAVFGASGSMKSRAFARNMLLQCVKRGESIVVTDPKSELYSDMAVYLKKNNYTVKVFNLVNPENSDSWNCLNEIKGQEIMAQLFSDVIIKNTGSEKADHFWDNSELNLLKALVLYVEQNYPPESRNIGEVYKLLTMNNEEALNKLFKMLPITHPAKSPYSIFKQAADNVRSGIIIGLGSRLQVFQNKMICNITSYDEIDLELPAQEKCAYFCITSDQDTTFDFLSSLFFSFLFIKLVRYADKYGKDGKLKIPVTFILDEFPNIGKIPDFTKKISTIRSRNISVSVIFQNLAQLENRYPLNQWQEIIGNCDTQLFLGCTDEVTAKFISDRTGEITVDIKTSSKQLNTYRFSDYTPEYRQTNLTGRRKLMTPDEVLRIPLEKALIILRGQKVLKVDKFDYSLHPESKKLIYRNASKHIPHWKIQENLKEKDCYINQSKNQKDKKKRQSIPKYKLIKDKLENIGTLNEVGTLKETESNKTLNKVEALKEKESDKTLNNAGDTKTLGETENIQIIKEKQITQSDKDSIMS